MLVEIRVKPGSDRDQILSFREPAFLEISLEAKAENNEANIALCKFLAKILEVSPDRIKILRGKSTRKKLISIDGIETGELKRRLLR